MQISDDVRNVKGGGMGLFEEIGITEHQEQDIRGALDRMRNPHPLNHYCKKRGRPAGQTNRPGRGAGRRRKQIQRSGRSGVQINTAHSSQEQHLRQPNDGAENIMHDLVLKQCGPQRKRRQMLGCVDNNISHHQHGMLGGSIQFT